MKTLLEKAIKLIYIQKWNSYEKTEPKSCAEIRFLCY